MNHQPVYNTHPSIVSINEDIGCLDRDGNAVELNQALIDTETVRLKAEYDSLEYARDRAKAYPSIADQLDDIYHNGVDGWKATIKAVKDTYPKETI